MFWNTIFTSIRPKRRPSLSAAALLHQNGSFFGLNVCIVASKARLPHSPSLLTGTWSLKQTGKYPVRWVRWAWDGSPPAGQNVFLHSPGPPEHLGTLSSRYVCYVVVHHYCGRLDQMWMDLHYLHIRSVCVSARFPGGGDGHVTTLVP